MWLRLDAFDLARESTRRWRLGMLGALDSRRGGGEKEDKIKQTKRTGKEPMHISESKFDQGSGFWTLLPQTNSSISSDPTKAPPASKQQPPHSLPTPYTQAPYPAQTNTGCLAAREASATAPEPAVAVDRTASAPPALEVLRRGRPAPRTVLHVSFGLGSGGIHAAVLGRQHLGAGSCSITCYSAAEWSDAVHWLRVVLRVGCLCCLSGAPVEAPNS